MQSAYDTSRLRVFEISALESQADLPGLLDQIVELLTPPVVENLPPYFQGVDSAAEAKAWLQRMVTDSHLFAINHRETDGLIGFLFVHVERNREAHIGYLLGEDYWGQGLATELLRGLVDYSVQAQQWRKLIGGVEKSNIASSRVLLKLGFNEQASADGPVVFYEYPLSRTLDNT